MFGFLKRKKKSLIGMDIGSNVVKCLRLDLASDRPVVTHFAMADLPPEAIVDGEIMDRELVIEAIQEAAQKAGIPDEPIASAVAGRAVIVKKIVMDKMSEADAREAIYWEAEQHVPFDIDDITLDFQILQDDIGADQMELLLVAAKKDMILGHAELIRDAGFQPAVIDVASFANQNTWEYLASHTAFTAGDEFPADEVLDEGDSVDDLAPFDEDDDVEAAAEETSGEFVALLDVGGGVTNVHIVRDGVPYFTRDLPIGVAHFIEEFQKQLGLTYDTAHGVARGHLEDVDPQLVADIVRSVGSEIYQGLEPSLSYLKTSGEADGIDRIVLSGGGAHLPGLLEYLSESYNVPAEKADPLAGLDYDPKLFGDGEAQELGSLLTVCVGLALRASGGSLIRINLLPRDEVPAPSRVAMPNVAAFAPLVLVLAAALGVSGSHWHQAQQISALEATIAEEEAETRRLAPEIAKIKRLNQQRKDLNDRLDVITRLDSDRYFRVHLMDELNKNMPQHMWLTRLEDIGADKYAVEGVTFSNFLISDFMQNITNSPYFAAVDLLVAEKGEIENVKVIKFKAQAKAVRKPASAPFES